MFSLDINVVLKIRCGKHLTCKNKFDKKLGSVASGYSFFFLGLQFFSFNLISFAFVFVCLFLYMHWKAHIRRGYIYMPRLHAKDLSLFFSVTTEHYNIRVFVEVFVDIFFSFICSVFFFFSTIARCP